MSGSLRTEDLIFPSEAFKTSDTLASLKRSALSIHNRLKSILSDASFVASVAELYNLPLIANERCGSWYIPPEKKAASAYFKSTDGHTGQWSFSLRRLNMHVFDVVQESGGCIIVDSTRRGKVMPDALSKTVPIWCCVWNRVLFPNNKEAGQLFMPPHVVSGSEKAQIEERLNTFQCALEGMNIDLESLIERLKKPLRPFWVTHGHPLHESSPEFSGAYPVVLCTSSHRVNGGEISEGGYIQGAGDDSESWANGLTPPVFWLDPESFLNAADEEIPDLIKTKTAAKAVGDDQLETAPILVRPTKSIFITTISRVHHFVDDYNRIIECSQTPTLYFQDRKKTCFLHLKCSSGKLGSRDLRSELNKIQEFVSKMSDTDSILICCHSGRDLSLGVALVLISLYCEDDGHFHPQLKTSKYNKQFIRQRLGWISASLPTANPSRATLNAVNSYILS